LFIMEYSTVLEDWQRDIMTIIREEMLYFWPQLETKIMNEGWASYRKGAYIPQLGVFLMVRFFYGCMKN
jgi:spore cortex formation protein SpoVR/YcgB (stage V sporulation)